MEATNRGVAERLPEFTRADGQAVAVVMGLRETGLSLARSLGRRGIDVIGVHTGSRPSAARSRYVHYVPGPDIQDDAATLEYYLELGKRIGGLSVLLPTGDPNVLFISRNRAALSEYFRFHVPEADLLERLASKTDFIPLAQQCDLPIPPTIRPRNSADLKRLLSAIELPCVIKPESLHGWLSTEGLPAEVRQAKVLPVENHIDLIRWYDRLVKYEPRLLVQQMVIGPDENHLDYHAMIDDDGIIRGEFVGQKLRVIPAHYGMGCYVESIESDEVRNAGRTVLRKLGYRGMANLNFKRDERDGQLYLFEVNPRFSIWTGLDVSCGVDFPYYYYKTCLGEKVDTPETYAVGRRWWNPFADLRAMRTYTKDGTWSWREWLPTLFVPCVNAVFSWDDPLPALTHIKNRIVGRDPRDAGDPQ